ncbi:hypothetical protein [Acinetobacter baumannii]|nr:hypothetical protein [Acinetobacter baumannii]
MKQAANLIIQRKTQHQRLGLFQVLDDSWKNLGGKDRKMLMSKSYG